MGWRVRSADAAISSHKVCSLFALSAALIAEPAMAWCIGGASANPAWLPLSAPATDAEANAAEPAAGERKLQPR